MADKSKPEAWTGERCFITELVNDAEWPAFSLARCRVEPGVTTELHALSVLEFYVVERGSGRMRIGDAPPFEIGPGDTVTIPHQAAQSVANTGNEDLVFLCLCTPRFLPDCYTSLE
jgi:mannose-6-phosphate isomerase-like protein (cupin superfamily)